MIYIAEEGLRRIINSIIDPRKYNDMGYIFRKYRYARVIARLTLNGKIEPIYLDTGYSVTVINRAYILRYLPEAKIR